MLWKAVPVASIGISSADANVMFSERTNWKLTPNRLTEALQQVKARGASVLDLTISNPTRACLRYDQGRILKSLALPESDLSVTLTGVEPFDTTDSRTGRLDQYLGRDPLPIAGDTKIRREPECSAVSAQDRQPERMKAVDWAAARSRWQKVLQTLLQFFGRASGKRDRKA